MTSAALVRSMLALRNERRTGVLTVDTSDGPRTFVYLLEGVPVFAEEGTHGETLGRLLLRQRQLTQEQYAHIIHTMTEALVINEQLRFGELAVELGYLSEAQVRKALVDQVRWKIVRVFQRGHRDQVTWSFEDSASRLDDVGRFPMRIEALVLDAVRWLDDEQKAEMGLDAAMESTITLDPSEAVAVASRFDLTAEETPLLALFDGRTVRAVLEDPRARDVDAPAILTAILVTRAAHTSTEPRLARPATPIQEISLQAITVSRPVAPPPAPAAKPPAPEAPKIARIKLTRASKILASLEERRVKVDAERKPESEHEAKLLAEGALQSGLPHLRAGRYAQAAPELARAARLMPQSEEYKLYARWCAVKAAGNPALHAGERAELGKLALLATKADPNFGFGYYVAGACALDDGDHENAFRLLDRAVKLDPGIPDANRLHRVASRDGNKSGLRGLFARDLFSGPRGNKKKE